MSCGTPAQLKMARRSDDERPPPRRGAGAQTTSYTRILSPARRIASLAFPLHRGGRTGIGLLTVDAPIAQFVERDRLAGDGAAHEGPRTENAIVAVDKFNFRFACVDRTPLKPVHRANSRLDVLCHDQCPKGTGSLAPGSGADSVSVDITQAPALWTRNGLSG